MKALKCLVMAGALLLCCQMATCAQVQSPSFFPTTTSEMRQFFNESAAAYKMGDYAPMADMIADLLVLNLATTPELLIYAENASPFKELAGFDWMTITSLIRDDTSQQLATIAERYPEALKELKRDVGRDVSIAIDESISGARTSVQEAVPQARAASFLKRADMLLHAYDYVKSAAQDAGEYDLKAKLLGLLLVLNSALSPAMIRIAEDVYGVEGTVLPLLAYADVAKQLRSMSERYPVALARLKEQVGADVGKAIDVVLNELKKPAVPRGFDDEDMAYMPQDNNIISMTYIPQYNETNPHDPYSW